jgi:hypothetical protein
LMQSHDVSPPPYVNLEPTAIHNPGSMPVKMEGCEVVWFKHCAVTKFLTMEKIPPIDIHCCMQAVYGDKCVHVGTVRRWVWEFKQEVR